MTSSILVLIVASLCFAVQAADVSLNSQTQQHIVDLHNQARKAEAASNMQDLHWDSALAKNAQTWTDKCVFNHQTGKSWGENLSAKSYHNTNLTLSLDAMFKLWMNEKSHNPGGTFEECCSRSHHTCCHYTQVIWAKTTKVGCGLTFCKSLQTSSRTMSNALFLACYYTPPGNHPETHCTVDWKPYLPKK